MLALEIHINDSEHFTVAADNLAFVDLNYGISKLEICGADDSYFYVWVDKTIQKGDKLFVRLVDVDKDKISSPQKATKRDREKMKQVFEKLKSELQEKQLI